MKLAPKPLLPTRPPSARPSKPSKSFFIAPLFSYSYESLSPQPLSFHIHTNPPGVWGYFSCVGFRITGHESQVIRFQSLAASLVSLSSLFQPPVLYFQQLAASFPRTPGVGGARLPISSARSLRPLRLCRCLFALFPFAPCAAPVSLRPPTADCRLPLHNAKIHPTLL